MGVISIANSSGATFVALDSRYQIRLYSVYYSYPQHQPPMWVKLCYHGTYKYCTVDTVKSLFSSIRCAQIFLVTSWHHSSHLPSEHCLWVVSSCLVHYWLFHSSLSVIVFFPSWAQMQTWSSSLLPFLPPRLPPHLLLPLMSSVSSSLSPSTPVL